MTDTLFVINVSKLLSSLLKEKLLKTGEDLTK